MRYLCKKIAIYNNVRMFCESVKSAFYLFKIPRVKIDFTRIRLIIAHVTLAHAIFNNSGTARLKKRRANYSDRLTSSSRSHSIEKSIKSRVFAGKINEKD
jgi:hypothetical protein